MQGLIKNGLINHTTMFVTVQKTHRKGARSSYLEFHAEAGTSRVRTGYKFIHFIHPKATALNENSVTVAVTDEEIKHLIENLTALLNSKYEDD